jgi:hypothetical protein
LQDLDLGLAILRVADQHLDQLLERQEPVGQLHVALADHFPELIEGSRILVVRIEQHHVRRRIDAQHLPQDQRRRARFTGPRGAQDGKMLAQHVVDADHGGDGRILTQCTDPHGVARITAKGLLELGARGRPDAIAERWIHGNAAIETRARAAAAFLHFADQPELGDPHLIVPSCRAGTGTLSAVAIASTTELAVSMANRVPISGRSTGASRPSRAERATSIIMMAFDPVTETMRPSERSLLLRPGTGCAALAATSTS